MKNMNLIVDICAILICIQTLFKLSYMCVCISSITYILRKFSFAHKCRINAHKCRIMSIIFCRSTNIKKKRENRELFSQSTRYDLVAYKKFRMKTCGDESLINRSTPRLHDTHDAALAIFMLICTDCRLVSCHHHKRYELCRKWYLNYFLMKKSYLITCVTIRRQLLTWLVPLSRLLILWRLTSRDVDKWIFLILIMNARA